MKKVRDRVKKYFVTGLLVIVPVWATFYVLSALLGWIDDILGDLPHQFVGFHFPGLGIVTLIAIVILVGLLSANYIGKRLVWYGDKILNRVPIVRGIYSTIKQITETFSAEHNFHGVALVEYPRKGSYTVGFITGEVPGERAGVCNRLVSVFVPTTPNPTAGFLLLIPEEDVKRLDMTVDQGMKFIVSLGLVPMPENDAMRLIAGRQEGQK